jgi:hypothetical protein
MGEKTLMTVMENIFSPDNIAVIERISLEQLCEQEAISILASCGSNGNSDMTEPY